MSTGACLIAYGTLVAFLAPRALTCGTWAHRIPVLGVAIWMSAMASVLAAWLVAIGAVIVDLNAGLPWRHVFDTCTTTQCALSHGTPGSWLKVGILTLATLVTGGALVGLGRALLHARRRTHRHAEAAHLVGERDQLLGAVILDVPEKVAYAVAGRPSAIVLSRPAIRALTAQQLRVIIAHERAHLAGRHHLVLAVSSVLADRMPRIPLFTKGRTELRRLVEMCADDTATRGRDVRDLLGALLALAGPAPQPRSALSAAATHVQERAKRLVSRPGSRSVRKTRALLLAGTAALLAGPVITTTALCNLLPLGL